MAQGTLPTFYPTASRVGPGTYKEDEKTIQETIELLKKVPRFVDLFEGRHKVRDSYIKQTCDLNFDFDVVKSRGKEAITFDMAKHFLLEDLKQAREAVEKRRKKAEKQARQDNGRMYANQPNVRTHTNCHAQASSDKFQKTTQLYKQFARPTNARDEPEVTKTQISANEKQIRSKKGQIDIKAQTELFKRIQKKKKAMTWDEYILTRVSKNTARWIVTNHVPSKDQKEHLKGFLDDRIGFQEQEDLFVDTNSELDALPDETETTKLRRLKTLDTPGALLTREGTLLTVNENLDKPFKSMYFRQNFLEEDEEMKKVIARSENRTAKIDLPGSSRLKGQVTRGNPEATEKKTGASVFITNEDFLQEMIDGSKPVFQKEAENELVLDSGNTYMVKKTEIFPGTIPGQLGVTKGKPQKWENFPKLKKDQKQMVAADYEKINYIAPPEKNFVKLDEEGNHRKMIVDKWLKSNKVGSMWHKAEIGDIIDNLESLDARKRLEAVAVCAQAAVYRLEKLSMESMAASKTDDPNIVIESEDFGYLPEGVLDLINLKLHDATEEVRFGAALTIFMLGTTSEIARKIMADVIDKASSTFDSKFIAAITLAYAGYVDSHIADIFIDCLLETLNQAEFDICVQSLAKMSDSNKVIHCLMGEKLNSSSWQHRFLACKVLPSLKGLPSKDVINKMIHLMWHDRQKTVRSSAAIALGKLNLGYYVHNKLMQLFQQTNRDLLLDAVVKAGQLGIMTNKLLPHFLKCFRHDYISVRVAACNTSGHLMLTHEDVLQELENLSQFDPSSKVKSAAIDALSQIGHTNTQISAGILWSVRWVQDLDVVISAARAIIKLNLRSPDATKVIQERLLSLTDKEAVEELKVVLGWLGEDPSGDLEMIRTLKEEIRKQSTKDNIIKMIGDLEEDDRHQELHDKLLYNGSIDHDLRAETELLDSIVESNSKDTSMDQEKAGFDNKLKNLANLPQSSPYPIEIDGLELKDDQEVADDIDKESVISNDSDDEAIPEEDLITRAVSVEKERKQSATGSKPSSSCSGPPKPTFFRSLALSRPSSNAEEESKAEK